MMKKTTSSVDQWIDRYEPLTDYQKDCHQEMFATLGNLQKEIMPTVEGLYDRFFGSKMMSAQNQESFYHTAAKIIMHVSGVDDNRFDQIKRNLQNNPDIFVLVKYPESLKESQLLMRDVLCESVIKERFKADQKNEKTLSDRDIKAIIDIPSVGHMISRDNLSDKINFDLGLFNEKVIENNAFASGFAKFEMSYWDTIKAFDNNMSLPPNEVDLLYTSMNIEKLKDIFPPEDNDKKTAAYHNQGFQL